MTVARKIYVRFLRPVIKGDLNRQRVKLLWFVWGYLPFLANGNLALRDRFRMLLRFLQVDWNVLHSHSPTEISAIARALTTRAASPGEVVVEAGCWQGGSSCKLSILCQRLGYRLMIYDSLAGVEPMTPEEIGDSYDFSGEYASSETIVKNNISRYGEISVCSFHKGWFRDTLARHPVPSPVRLGYIDCDLAKGTQEALQGITPSLVEGGVVFSQDFHIEPVKALLLNPGLWQGLGLSFPRMSQRGPNLVCMHIEKGLSVR